MEINERLKYLRTEILGVSQAEVGKVLGITKSGVSLIEKKQRRLTTKYINRLCEYYKVNREWLINGNGDVFGNKQFTYVLQDADIEIDIDCLQKYLDLAAKERTLVKEYIEKLHKLHE